MIKAHELIKGKYYQAVFNGNSVWLCRATSRSTVRTLFHNGHPNTTTGGIRTAVITEISQAYALSGGKAVENNLDAKRFLDTEY